MYLANRTLVHTDTTSITLPAGRPFREPMKPRIQCVVTHWMSGFIASGGRAFGRALESGAPMLDGSTGCGHGLSFAVRVCAYRARVEGDMFT